jgi:phospholipid transport system transporter-binding protein
LLRATKPLALAKVESTVLNLPVCLTAREATATRHAMVQALAAQTASEVVLDASELMQFDSAALAVLLACQRAAQASNKSFILRNMPAQLAALAKLYGVDVLLMPSRPTTVRV